MGPRHICVVLFFFTVLEDQCSLVRLHMGRTGVKVVSYVMMKRLVFYRLLGPVITDPIDWYVVLSVNGDTREIHHN